MRYLSVVAFLIMPCLIAWGFYVLISDIKADMSVRKEAAKYCYSKGEDVWVEWDDRLQQYICVSSGIKRRVE